MINRIRNAWAVLTGTAVVVRRVRHVETAAANSYFYAGIVLNPTTTTGKYANGTSWVDQPDFTIGRSDASG